MLVYNSVKLILTELIQIGEHDWDVLGWFIFYFFTLKQTA